MRMVFLFLLFISYGFSTLYSPANCFCSNGSVPVLTSESTYSSGLPNTYGKEPFNTCGVYSSSGSDDIFEYYSWTYNGDYYRDGYDSYISNKKTYNCNIANSNCADGGPSFTNSDGSTTCIRACEDVGLVTTLHDGCIEKSESSALGIDQNDFDFLSGLSGLLSGFLLVLILLLRF